MVCDAGFRVVAAPPADSERFAMLGRGVSSVCTDAAKVLAQGI